jgi:hypothetical protein
VERSGHGPFQGNILAFDTEVTEIMPVLLICRSGNFESGCHHSIMTGKLRKHENPYSEKLIWQEIPLKQLQ